MFTVHPTLPYDRRLLTLTNNLTTVYQKGHYVTICPSGDLNFGHFIIDFLPGLHWAKHCIAKHYKIIVPSLQPHFDSFIYPCIQALRIPANNLYYINQADQHIIHQFQYLHIVPMPNQFYPFTRRNIILYKEIRSFFQDGNISKKYSAYKRIYLTRQRRDINNRNEILTLLKEYGFIPVDVLDYSFKELINLLSNTEIFISASGANLSHLPLCNPGTKMISFENNLFSAEHLLINYYGMGYTMKFIKDNIHNNKFIVHQKKIVNILNELNIYPTKTPI